jgi:hypothetical protein
MNKNNPHKALRSSWRSEAFKAAKTKGIVIINRSLGQNGKAKILKSGGSMITTADTNRQSYLY